MHPFVYVLFVSPISLLPTASLLLFTCMQPISNSPMQTLSPWPAQNYPRKFPSMLTHLI